MSLVKKVFSICLAIISCSVTAKIYEINTISEVLDYATHHSLVLFDLDNTLFTPKSSLIASPQWFEFFFAHLKQLGYSRDQIISLLGPIHYDAQEKAIFSPVEPSSDRIVETLQRKGVPVLALTARGSINLTKKQLKRARIDLKKTAQKNICYTFATFSPPAYYTPGILFANGNNKGHVIEAFLQRLKNKPHFNEIIVIDDRLYNLENIEKSAKKMGLKFVGLRYGYLDPQVNLFEKEMHNSQKISVSA